MPNTAPSVEVLSEWQLCDFQDRTCLGWEAGATGHYQVTLLPPSSGDFQAGGHHRPVLGKSVLMAQGSPLMDSGSNPSTLPALGYGTKSEEHGREVTWAQLSTNSKVT